MEYGDTILFTTNRATMYIEIERAASGFCHDEFNVTLTEYELLGALYAAGTPRLVHDVASFLVLEEGSLLKIVRSLMDRGYIEGTADVSDARYLLMSLSAEGVQAARACGEGLSDFMESMTQESLPESEFAQSLFPSIPYNLDSLRKVSSEPWSGEGVALPRYRVEFPVFVRVILDQWRECVRENSDMSLREFRILKLLSESGPMRGQDIAERLLMHRSQVSAGACVLKEIGMVAVASNPFDGRSRLLNATPIGRIEVDKLRPDLDRICALGHKPVFEGGSLLLEAWHSRMYYNLKRHREMVEHAQQSIFKHN